MQSALLIVGWLPMTEHPSPSSTNTLPDEPPAPAWHPSAEIIANANVTAVARQLGLPDYAALHQWSCRNREAYWQLVIDRVGIKFREPFAKILDATEPTRPRWLVGAKMNVVDSCFDAAVDPASPAIIESSGGSLRTWTINELRRLAARVCNGLIAGGIMPGDAVAVVMPMTARSVAIYLGIIAAGAAVVSIADSFAPDEIATRLRVGNAKWVFTQDLVLWGARRLALYEKIVAAGAAKIVVCPADAGSSVILRQGDIAFDDFLSSDDRLMAVACAPHDPINVLFSSGTTGDPKAIPWDHTTPIKCAADGHFHQDLHPGDVVCWPTSLGWMMGPWLIFAALLNRATIALHAQTPTEANFGRFVQDAGVTMLGVVPSLVRSWKQSQCMEQFDWTKIRAFSSSGECSNAADMLYLMQLAGGRPVIEYCGGTEIGGAYITGTVVQPSIPATFTTPALGLNFVLLDDDGKPASRGEALIEGPSIGLSTRLLNRDHDSIYFDYTPMGENGFPLRRHGDEIEALPGGYFRVIGRSDDTMNLGGIKVGCAEIERALNAVPEIAETAAVAMAPAGGGPSRLVIYAVPVAGAAISAESLKPLFQQAIRDHLNPLFHVDEVRLTSSLPRTASNKIIRRTLRAELKPSVPLLSHRD